MSEQTTEEKPGADRKGIERSPNYPALTFTAAESLIKALYHSEKRTWVSADVVAKAFGYGSLSGAARTAIASLRQYGLIESGESGLRVSDLAVEIMVQPIGSPERRKAMQAAALKPPLFAEMAQTHAEASDEAVKAYLITKRKFSPDGAGRFVIAFREAIQLANIPVPGYTGGTSSEGSRLKETATPTGARPVAPAPAAKPGDRMEFTWTLSDGATATLLVSKGIEPDDVDTLYEFLATTKRALTKVAAAVVAQRAAIAAAEASDASGSEEA